MKPQRLLLSFGAGAVLMIGRFAPQSYAGSTTPSRVSSSQLPSIPFHASGVIWGDSLKPGFYTRGSGTVAANPRIAVSCAHVIYQDGQWLRNFKFAPAYHGSRHPDAALNKTTFRGNWHWTGYSGGTSASAFDDDFVVHYAYSNLAGGFFTSTVGNETNTNHPLNRTNVRKLIVGYPGSDSFYMNVTGEFTNTYRAQAGHFMWNPSVKGGGGMSGGGVFAYTEGAWRLAGVHVSGFDDGSMGAGARALNQKAFDLINRAIASSGGSVIPPPTTRTFSSSSSLSIPDNRTAWTVRSLSVSSMPANLTAATVSLNISHTWKGDLEVMLTAPNGRSLTLHNRTGGGEDNVILTGQDISSSFSGANPNGAWNLSVRDLDSLDIGRLNSVSLTISSR